MIQISEATLQALTVHSVGNKCMGGELVPSEVVNENLGEEISGALMHYFFTPFKGDAFFNFTHPTDLQLNEVFACCSAIFDDNKSFMEKSREIARHLYNMSDHPNIKDGELYVALIRDVVVESEICDAIGIFKSESKEPFLRFQRNGSGAQVEVMRGANVNKLDKGCLVFQTEKDEGFKVCAIDNTNRSSEAVYWKEAFLRIKPREDSYYQTRGYMEVCKGFVKEVFNTENEVGRIDQAVMLNKTAEFFKTNEVFKEEVFEAEVMQQPEIIEAFQEYKEKYQTMNQVALKEEFSIATDVAKKMQKNFKSVIKLDKNFHVYIHGDEGMIERGYDEEVGKHFYKVYFEKEA
jgi:hypothetical protein